MGKFEIFEKDVVENILKTCDNDLAPKILEQYKKSTVINREFTGVGFFTSFQVEDKSLSLGSDVNFGLGSIGAEIEGLKYKHAGFILYIEDGLLAELEGYSCGDDGWPNEITEYSLYIINKDGSSSEI